MIKKKECQLYQYCTIFKQLSKVSLHMNTNSIPSLKRKRKRKCISQWNYLLETVKIIQVKQINYMILG